MTDAKPSPSNGTINGGRARTAAAAQHPDPEEGSLVDHPSSNSFLQDFALQQHMLQIKQQQLIQQQYLEQQYQQNREMLRAEHERQLSLLISQVEAQKQANEAAAAAAEHERLDKVRLEALRQKSHQKQSAVASPEVKRHLQEFVLQKKRKEAAVSMSNLKTMPTVGSIHNGSFGESDSGRTNNSNVAAGSASPQGAMLRKTASESNLLKMKSGKRNLSGIDGSGGRAGPYHRLGGACNPNLYAIGREPSIPETQAVSTAHNSPGSGMDSLHGSPGSNHSASSFCSNSVVRPSLSRDLSLTATDSTPTSPKHPPKSSASFSLGALAKAQQQNPNHPCNPKNGIPAHLSGRMAHINSKSLPNIPSAIGRFAGKDNHHLNKIGRRSPPSHVMMSGAARPSHHSAMLVRRSKSSAILPLRKHLMEKSLLEQKAKEEEQQQQQNQLSTIRPIEEVVEEDGRPPKPKETDMDVDDDRPLAVSFAARLGHSGLSPLVLGDVESPANDFLNSVLPAAYQQQQQFVTAGLDIRTGIGYDPVMLKHQCECKVDTNHPENPFRVGVIWDHLVTTKLVDLCSVVAREATLEEIQTVHSSSHTIFYGSDSTTDRQASHGLNKSKFSLLRCGGIGVDSDTYWNERHTSVAVRYAVGTVIELCKKVVTGELKNGLALVRPPGHHAEREEAMGFCYFNSVAVSAKNVLTKTSAKKVLIIDWAIHHGNGTQQAFYESQDVLYISLHRYDNGTFYPGTGGPAECGDGSGRGYNVNIAWTGGLEPPMGDAEYLAAFRTVVLPIARMYGPDLVIVSAGFDAAIGHDHPIGGYQVSTACFAFLTLQLKQLAQGKVVLALEGGYNLDVLRIAVDQCLKALVGLPLDKIAEGELARRPNQHATETLQKTLAVHSVYWDVVKSKQESATLSHLEAWEKERTSSVNEMLHQPGPVPLPSSVVNPAGSGGDLVALSAMASLSMKSKYRSSRHLSMNASTSGSEDQDQSPGNAAAS